MRYLVLAAALAFGACAPSSARQVDDLTTQNDALTSQMDDLTTQNDALTSQVDDLTSERDALSPQVDASASHNDTLASENHDLQTEVNDLQGQVDFATEVVWCWQSFAEGNENLEACYLSTWDGTF